MINGLILDRAEAISMAFHYPDELECAALLAAELLGPMPRTYFCRSKAGYLSAALVERFGMAYSLDDAYAAGCELAGSKRALLCSGRLDDLVQCLHRCITEDQVRKAARAVVFEIERRIDARLGAMHEAVRTAPSFAIAAE